MKVFCEGCGNEANTGWYCEKCDVYFCSELHMEQHMGDHEDD